MDVPLALRLSLRRGCVYYFVDSSTTSVEPHYFIVMNSAPLGDELLVLCIVTSNVARVRRMRSALQSTTVELEPTDWPEVLTTSSIIDGNVVFRRDLAGFVDRWKRKEIKECSRIPDFLLEKVRAAIQASPLVEQALKDLL